MAKTSIRWEISFFIVLFMIIVIGILSFFVLRAQKEELTNEVKLRGISIAKNLANSISDFILTEDELSIARIMSETMNNKGVEYALVVDEQNVIKAHNNLELLGTTYKEPDNAEVTEEKPYKILLYMDGKNDKKLDFSAPVIAKGKIKLGTVHLGISYSIIEDVIKSAYLKVGIISAIAILFGIIGAFILGMTITKPIGELANGARIAGTGNLDHKIKVKANNELGELANIFNVMTDNLKKAQEIMIKQQRLERELEVAREIQLSLIPKDIVKIPNYEINAFYQPAKEVGGDYYDVLPLNKERYGIVMGDVSGKGVPAALIMTMARSILHSVALKYFNEPASETLKELNSIIYKDIKEDMFLTIFYGILDITRNIVDVASAGHNDTLVFRKKTETVEPYNPKGFPIGTDPGPRFEKVIKHEEILIEKGDKIVIFTDGITEAMNKENKEYGAGRLFEVIKNNGNKNGRDMVETIISDVNNFVNGAEQSDDIALVVVERKS
ncbi:MAG: SpoIIE family protein phosphatase [Candidatus Goldbacteria bacterium]|nr:SpoIIE family protein phosphatase [Candidatus Goldiibacteriota bacterium]